jgi:murein DD-endopeptidase MepM/ murein hydrolase activator NlpD
LLEIQFHPARSGGKVRYLLLSRRSSRWLVATGGALAIAVLVGFLVAPLGVESLLLTGDLEVLGQQSRLQREILRQREEALHRLEGRLAVAKLRERQISLVLGASGSATQARRGGALTAGGEGEVPEARLALYRGLRLQDQAEGLLARCAELAARTAADPELTRTVPSVCPLPVDQFVLTSPFGERVSQFTGAVDFHAGVDLAAREGTAVRAAGGGQVLFAGSLSSRRERTWRRYGNVVLISHDRRYVTVYAHLGEIRVRRGATVARGTVLGTVGSSGWSSSPHLHYEVRVVEPGKVEPVPVDPRVYILNHSWSDADRVLAEVARAPGDGFDPLPVRW